MADQSLTKQGLPFIGSILGGSAIFALGLGLGMDYLIASLACVLAGVGLILFGLIKFFLSLGGKDS